MTSLKCKRCRKEINPKEKYASLDTYNKGKLKDKSPFHFKCFLIWIDKKTIKKAKIAIKNHPIGRFIIIK